MADGRGTPTLRETGEGCLWLIAIGVVVYFAAQLARTLQLVVLPAFLALVLAALLSPLVRRLGARGLPPLTATLTVLVGALALLLGLGAWIVPQVGGQVEELSTGLTEGLTQVERWLVEGPLNLSQQQVADAFDRLEQLVRDNLGTLAQLGVTGATVVLQLLAGLLLAVVVLFFFLKDGDHLWNGLLTFTPARHRQGARAAGEGGWDALGGFLRAQTLVAVFDAVFIGLALVIVGVPLALPLIVITFFAAYVPYIGAISAGAAAVLIALVAKGFTSAVIVLAAIVVVQQLEGNVVQPLVMGRTLQVHPVIIVLGVVTGGILGGVVGSIVAAPVVAAATGIVHALRAAGDDDARPLEAAPG
jgi:predicted PurR-regulated permease PerM